MAVGPRLRVVCCLHGAAFIWCSLSIWRHLAITDNGQTPSRYYTYGGRWKYLTFINQVLQTILFGICLLTDLFQLFGSNKKEGFCLHLLVLRDCFFSILAFPVGTFVVASFWGIYAYDRELIYPTRLDKVIPLWLNHAMHTVVLPLLLLQLITCFHQYPGRKKGLLGLGIFCFAYLIWMLWIKYIAGIWVYPFLAKMDSVGMVVFVVVSILIMTHLYFLGEFLTKLFWGKSAEWKKTA
ncbi:androgen-induced gene 1 protein isoform X2 [Microcaecilia unicolor]|uniref:Androgen-induced gene 1 protein-like isoform X2 n=1 Tax=Microcaecilia unicolor TaxID=1415580 RepID=A0A6P7YP59_9AMPH|nr:androgen-induced gene 1 protein-like isoform X2 [Microcaecilia unicolor]